MGKGWSWERGTAALSSEPVMRLCGYARELRRRTDPGLTSFHTSLSLSFLIWEMAVKGNPNLFPQAESIHRSTYTHSIHSADPRTDKRSTEAGRGRVMVTPE